MHPEASNEPAEVEESVQEQQEHTTDLPKAQAAAGSTARFPIVGMGASQGGLRAFEQFFKHLPDDSGMAFVLVQHLPTGQQIELAERLQDCTPMKVQQVEEDTAVQPNSVYVLPPGKDLIIEAGVLKLSDPVHRVGHRLPVDHFLRSLAGDQGARAVGIIFSGTGSDGTLGLKAIKEHDGLTMAQDPDAAEYDGMPKSALHTGLADLVGTAGELAEHLVAYRQSAAIIQLPDDEEALPKDDAEVLQRILAQLRLQTGHDFKPYKRSTILRRLGRRLQIHRVENLVAYLGYLQQHPNEAHALFQDFIISVTNFFRDPAAFQVLEQKIIPEIFRTRPDQDAIRVWVPGCATGEEAYSMAILLCEQATTLKQPPAIQVFATDIDEHALSFARAGLYPEFIADDVSPERLRRFFSEEGSGYRVKKSVREVVLFAAHNLLNDPPFSRLDLISCRNVLIYLKRDVQGKIFEMFHYALRPDGFLVTGSSESADARLFVAMDKKQRVFKRREAADAARQFPFVRRVEITEPPETGTSQPDEDVPSLEAQYQAWTLEHHVPPRLIVNEHYDITHIFGRAGRYVQDQEGAVTQNVLHKVVSNLRVDLRGALYEAFHKGKTTKSRYLPIEIGGQPCIVRLHVGPFSVRGMPARHAEVVFQEVDPEVLALSDADVYTSEGENSLVVQLEEELQLTKERLQTIIEEHETSNEELKATNEELQSMNEELQSTTEELETSKEELQSMNEELVSVNQELKARVDDLARANSDLQNLMESTDVGTLFLNRDLCVVRYTPRLADLFNIIPADIGRPFMHISHKIDHQGLPELAERVLRRLDYVEEEIQSKDGRWYTMRMLPYRTLEDLIDGVVITIVDVTRLKEAELEVQRRARQQATVADLGQLALKGVEQGVLMQEAVRRVAETLDMDYCKVLELLPDGERLLLKAGVGWKQGYVGKATVAVERGSQAGYTLHIDEPVVAENLSEETRFTAPPLLVEHDVVSGMSITIPGIQRPYGVLGVHSRQPRRFVADDPQFLQAVANVLAEAIERQRARDGLHELYQLASQRAAVLDAIIESMPDAVYVGNDTGVTRINKLALKLLGAESQDDLKGRSVERGQKFNVRWASTGQPIEDGKHPFTRALQGEMVVEEILATRGDTGEDVYLRTAAAPIMQDGKVIGAVSINSDITERFRQEQALREREQELEMLTEALEERVEERTRQVRRLASDLTLAEQRERRRVSQILHDDLQQLLYGLQIKMKLLDNDIAGQSPEAMRKRVEDLRQLVQDALTTTKTLTVELSPPVLEGEGIGASLQWLGLHMEEMYKLTVVFEGEPDTQVPHQEMHVLLFQLVRELLFNVVKHAETDKAIIRLREEEKNLIIEVEDQGVGFDPEDKMVDTNGSHGFGLYSVQERLRLFDGRLEVHATPGEGTRMTIYAPRSGETNQTEPAK